jgi:hypothetical protein
VLAHADLVQLLARLAPEATLDALRAPVEKAVAANVARAVRAVTCWAGSWAGLEKGRISHIAWDRASETCKVVVVRIFCI